VATSVPPQKIPKIFNNSHLHIALLIGGLETDAKINMTNSVLLRDCRMENWGKNFLSSTI
jgi:hypothetical protein